VYGLHHDVDLSFLMRREVLQVCIGMFQVQIHFDQNVSISVEARLQYTDRAGKTFEWLPNKPSQAATTVDLLGLVISDLRPEPNGTLTLIFSDIAKLIIFDDHKRHESYQIVKPGTTIVV
jgi:hypothetical protein